MKKEVKSCIEYYLNNINSDEYKEYKIETEAERKRMHCEYIEREKEQWRNRVDFYDDPVITHISICDILSNDGIVKLLKKIYSLPSKKFKVKNYYKKPTLKNKYDYVHLQYSSSGYGTFAEVELLDDKYIKDIEISWGQINSHFAFLEYKFTFKKCLNDSLYDQFIYDNIRNLNSKDYLIWYNIVKQMDNKINYEVLEQMNSEYFSLICQHYITSFFYSEQGKANKLINIVYMTRKKTIDIETIYLIELGISYYNKKSNYIITGDLNGINYYLLAGDNVIPNFSISDYIFKYGNEFYNHFFGYRELKIFEKEFSKFTTGRKKITYNNKLKMLLSKMQSLSDVESRRNNKFYDEFNSIWDFYVGNEKIDLKEYHRNSKINYKEIYKGNFLYLKLLSEMNYTKSNQINSIVATGISIIATIIAIIALLNDM